MSGIDAVAARAGGGGTGVPVFPAAERIARFCRERQIRRLSLFGSAVRGDFVPGRSDLDMLVEYRAGCHPGIGHFTNADDLSELFGVRVDLSTGAMLGRFLPTVRREESVIYDEARSC